MENCKSDENLHSISTSQNQTDNLFSPSPTIRAGSTSSYDYHQHDLLSLPHRATNKTRSTSADIYLQSPKVKSSSSSNLSIHLENASQNNISLPSTTVVTNSNSNYKPFQSAIYSTDSIASTSSLSSNLLNSTSPSPSYQRNKSQQELDSNLINVNNLNESFRPPQQSNELQIPKTYRNAYILSKSNINDDEITRITQGLVNEPRPKSFYTIELTSIGDNRTKSADESVSLIRFTFKVCQI